MVERVRWPFLSSFIISVKVISHIGQSIYLFRQSLRNCQFEGHAIYFSSFQQFFVKGDRVSASAYRQAGRDKLATEHWGALLKLLIQPRTTAHYRGQNTATMPLQYQPRFLQKVHVKHRVSEFQLLNNAARYVKPKILQSVCFSSFVFCFPRANRLTCMGDGTTTTHHFPVVFIFCTIARAIAPRFTPG